MTGEKSSKRDQLLGKAKSFASKTINVEGVDVEVRQPTVGARSAILKAAGMTDGDSTKDVGKLQVFAVMFCCFDPDTGKHFFERTDEAALEGMPSGSWVDDLSAAAIDLMNVQPAEDAKNLDETPADSSSSR